MPNLAEVESQQMLPNILEQMLDAGMPPLKRKNGCRRQQCTTIIAAAVESSKVIRNVLRSEGIVEPKASGAWGHQCLSKLC